MKKDFIYLASASPRRRELLEQIGVAFEAHPADLVERRLPDEPPADFVVRMAQDKARHVAQRLADAAARPVLAADTIVVLKEQVFGKPASPAEAQTMLAQLSGATHQVLTAVAVLADGEIQDRLSVSKVRMRTTTQEQRSAYARTGEPLDKAGGYAIQGLGAVFVESVQGSYSGVVGLPLADTAVLLRRCGLPAWLEGRP